MKTQAIYYSGLTNIFYIVTCDKNGELLIAYEARADQTWSVPEFSKEEWIKVLIKNEYKLLGYL